MQKVTLMKKFATPSIILLIVFSGISITLLQEPATNQFKVKNFSYNYFAADNSSIDFEAELANKTITENSSASIKISLIGQEDDFMTYTGPYPPFGVPTAEKQSSNYSINLRSDNYSDRQPSPGYASSPPKVAINKTWNQSSITQEFELRSEDQLDIRRFSGEPIPNEKLKLREGNYTIKDSIGYSFNHSADEWKWLDYRIEFEVVSD